MMRLRLSGAKGSSLTTCFLGRLIYEALWLLPIVGREPGNIAQARRPNYPITSYKDDRYVSSHEFREFHAGS
jgi:hypothetical protein